MLMVLKVPVNLYVMLLILYCLIEEEQFYKSKFYNIVIIVMNLLSTDNNNAQLFSNFSGEGVELMLIVDCKFCCIKNCKNLCLKFDFSVRRRTQVKPPPPPKEVPTSSTPPPLSHSKDSPLHPHVWCFIVVLESRFKETQIKKKTLVIYQENSK